LPQRFHASIGGLGECGFLVAQLGDVSRLHVGEAKAPGAVAHRIEN